MPKAAVEVAPGLYVLPGAVNVGLLRAGEQALLFDCCDSLLPQHLASLGVRRVDMILCTQHRRPNVAGARTFAEAGAAIVVPEAERPLFEDVSSYWEDWRNRWHIYHHRPGPQVLAQPLPVARSVREGDAIEWHGAIIRVLETPGPTDGSTSYLMEAGGRKVCFCGDVLFGDGQVWELYSLQKGFGGILDYHGFLGNLQGLKQSLRKLAGCGAELLVPSHGPIIREPKRAVALALERLSLLWRNYSAISSLNYYFPALLRDTQDDPWRMKPARTQTLPSFVRRVAFTSFALISDSGAALLVDCGHDSVVETLQHWIRKGAITSVEACWVTHYHDDHVDALHRLAQAFGCPILADSHVAPILRCPLRFFLPCISPNPAPVTRGTLDGESWSWREFNLTAFHFPGQSLYHGGLLVEGHGLKLFFVGDSFSPAGIDDYCSGNRNFLGAERGFRRCLAILRRHRPDLLINQHQDRAFSFTQEQLDHMDSLLVEREKLLAALLPWQHPDFGTDEWWVRSYPFEQEACPGSKLAIDVQFTNHGDRAARAAAEPVLPAGWRWQKRALARTSVPARAEGAVRIWLCLPADAEPARHVIPLRVWWAGRYLGQCRHAVVVVR